MALDAAYFPAEGEVLGFLVEDRIVGMPDWLTQERYDIYARIAHRCVGVAGPSAAERDATGDDADAAGGAVQASGAS